MTGRAAPIAIVPSFERGCRLRRRRESPRSGAPAVSDRSALAQCARSPAARQRPRPDAEIVDGEVSFEPPFLHIIRSPRRRGRLGVAEGAHSDSVIGWLNSEVAPSADVSVAVNEAGIAASLEASTVSENLPLPSASDVVTTSPRNISPSPLPDALLPNTSTVKRDSGLPRRAPCMVSPFAL